MSIFEILLIGVGLSMDAVAVSMTNGMVYNNLKLRHYGAMPVFFGAFQGIMPLIGFYAGSLFADIISKYSGIVILLILGVIGSKMIWDGCHHHEEEKPKDKLTVGMLFLQAIATSIDAFAVGVGFSAAEVNIFLATILIACTTAVLSIIAILVGKKFGNLLGSKAEILGGVILVIIGIKAII